MELTGRGWQPEALLGDQSAYPYLRVVLVGAKLHLDHDGEHGSPLDQEHDQIRVVARWDELVQLRRVDANFAVRRQLHRERLLQQLRRQRRARRG